MKITVFLICTILKIKSRQTLKIKIIKNFK